MMVFDDTLKDNYGIFLILILAVYIFWVTYQLLLFLIPIPILKYYDRHSNKNNNIHYNNIENLKRGNH